MNTPRGRTSAKPQIVSEINNKEYFLFFLKIQRFRKSAHESDLYPILFFFLKKYENSSSRIY